MKRRPLTTFSGSCYADFGLSPLEILKCTFCGITQRATIAVDGFSLIGYVVPPSALCPVTGMVGVCRDCLSQVRPGVFVGARYRDRIQNTDRCWSPPATVQPIPRYPIYLVTRKFCDEDRLAELVRATWKRIPTKVRGRMRPHWKTEPRRHSLCNGPLRIEALPSWPRYRRQLGVCMMAGHAIRLHSPTVESAPDEVLSTLIAHELAHCFQHATGANWSRPKRAIEGEVHRLLDEWGFRQSAISKWWQKQSDEKFSAWLRQREA
jgi:hypothetical protein